MGQVAPAQRGQHRLGLGRAGGHPEADGDPAQRVRLDPHPPLVERGGHRPPLQVELDAADRADRALAQQPPGLLLAQVAGADQRADLRQVGADPDQDHVGGRAALQRLDDVRLADQHLLQLLGAHDHGRPHDPVGPAQAVGQEAGQLEAVDLRVAGAQAPVQLDHLDPLPTGGAQVADHLEEGGAPGEADAHPVAQQPLQQPGRRLADPGLAPLGVLPLPSTIRVSRRAKRSPSRACRPTAREEGSSMRIRTIPSCRQTRSRWDTEEREMSSLRAISSWERSCS